MEVPEIPDLIIYAIPFFIITLFIEILVDSREKTKAYETKDAITSISMGLGNVILGIISKVLVFSVFLYLYDNLRLFTLPFTWWTWFLILFVDDFAYYWFHRISHESRFFWASHVVHHSSQKYNLSTALRQTWSGGFLGICFLVTTAIIRFSSSQ